MFTRVYATLLTSVTCLIWPVLLSSRPIMICIAASMTFLIWPVSLPPMTSAEYKLPSRTFYDLPSMTCIASAFYDPYCCLIWRVYRTNCHLWPVSLHSMTCIIVWFLWIKKIRSSNSMTCYWDFYVPIRFKIQIFPSPSFYMRFCGCMYKFLWHARYLFL